MTDSILIGKHIYKLLSENEELSGHISDKVFPIIAEDGTTFPFVIYERNSIKGNYCKDGLIEDEVSFGVMVVSLSYLESIEIAQIIRKIFDKNRLLGDIYNCRLEQISEDYRDNAYIQQLNFNCKIRN
ncbi:hypothetical protein HDR70_00335 [bacterium]|nr:hypothetical protein [bacterium]